MRLRAPADGPVERRDQTSRGLGSRVGLVHFTAMGRQLTIAIAGAGVGGLACAILLARAGHRVELFERFDESRPVGSGLMIQPTGLAALEVLGLRGELAALGARLTRLHGATTAGTTIFDVAYEDLAPGLHALGVHRAALHGVLWRAFAACGAGFTGGRAVTGLELASGGQVLALLEDGERAGPFDLLVDATGARSALRSHVDPRPARPFAYGAVWAAVPAIGLAPHALTQRYVAAHTMIGHLPCGQVEPGGPQLTAFFWSLKTEALPQWRKGFEGWRDEVVQLWPEMAPVVAGFAGPDDLMPASYHHATAAVPVRGPLVLVADSAHCTSPQLGQGANNALLDACALAAGLAGSPTLEAGLAAYARFRRPHVRFYQLASALMTPFFQGDSRILPWARDLVFNRLKIVPWLRHEMVRTLSGLKTGPLTHASPDYLASRKALFSPPA
jgi:2-polyprenyl-6-methoxyphenol hydroxylase-like FAD-dependent oxidoreductase